MNPQHIFAMTLRYFYNFREPTRIMEFLFWPVVDLAFMGLIALWAQTLSQDFHIVKMFVTALVLWQIIYRSNFEVCVNILDEILDSNLVHLVASPLTKGEWIVSMMISGAIKIIFTLLFGALIGFVFFHVNIFSVGFALVPLIIFCLVAGWIVGFVGAGLLICTGKKLIQLPWIVIMLSAVFSATYYPTSVFPPYVRWIVEALPMSYIFEGMRSLFMNGYLSMYHLILSVILSAVYLTIAIKFFLIMFERSRNRGLQRLS